MAYRRSEAGVLKVGADDVADLPDLGQGLLELIVQLQGAVHPQGPIRQPDHCSSATHIDAVPQEGTAHRPDILRDLLQGLTCATSAQSARHEWVCRSCLL